MHKHPSFDGSFRVLCDYTACNWAPMLGEFRRLDHSVVNLLNDQQPQGVVAFVLRTETEKQIMEQISREYPWDMSWATFTDRELALAWLMAQPV